MQIEILTLAECRERLLVENTVTPKSGVIATLIWLIPSVIISGFLALIFWILLSHTVDDLHVAFHIIGWCICALPSVLLFILFFKTLMTPLRFYRKIQTAGIEIVEDTLQSAYEESEMKGRHHWLFFVLKFRDHGKYRLPDNQHYTWSKLYTMSKHGVYNTSIPGDTFYIVQLVGDPSHKPLEVYNAKLFELCPDGTERKPLSSWRDSVSLE